MKNAKILLLILTISSFSFGQTLYKNISPKIHPFFQTVIDNANKSIPTNKYGVNSIATNANGEKIYEAIIQITDETEILNSGVNVNSVIPGYATARITLNEIVSLSKQNYVVSIYPPEILYPTNDVSNAVVGADLVKNGYINGTSYDGSGVIVMIIDTGIDWTIEDFQNSGSPNTSRILYVWDQTLTKSGSENDPSDNHGAAFSTLNYGVEYLQADINDEIDGTPTGFIRENDTHGHGTHVAGTSCGNGNSLSTNKYSGIASSADIVVVKAGNGSFTSTNIINALKYAKEIANETGKPVVANLSLGGHANPHDGSSDQDVAVDDFTSSGTGRVAVISAGNSGNDLIHISGSVAAGGTRDIRFDVPSRTSDATANNEYFYFDLYWNNGDDVSATVLTPNSYSYTRNASSHGTSQTDDGTIYLYNFVAANGERRNYVHVYDGIVGKEPADGTWYLRVNNNSLNTMTFHGWLFANSISTTLNSGDSDYTIGAPGDATTALTVGSYVSRWRWSNNSGSGYSYSGTNRSDDISSFSSIGPRTDGVQKPDIVAPGQGIISCTSKDYAPYASANIVSGKYHLNQGTSMSAPVVTGSVALMLDANSSLSATEVKGFITGNADSDSKTGATLPDYTWGYGKLNIFRAVVSAVNSVSVTNELIAQQDFQSGVGTTTASDYWYSETFTPSISGKVTEVLFHPGVGASLANNLPIEIWDDNGGNPNSLLGSTVSFSQDKLLPNSWNKLYFASGSVPVTAGNTYHIVLKTPSSSSFNFITGGTSHSQYSTNSGANWNSYTDDIGIRAIISPLESATPVEINSFYTVVENEKVILNWTTATEINNYGFEIQVSTNKTTEWETIGFVNGHGNSNSPNEYNFVDTTPHSETVNYRLKQVDTDGSFEYSEIVEVTLDKVYKYSLEQNHPNPFNPTTELNYTIPNDSKVKVEIYNTLGQRVAELVNINQNVGNHSVTWNAIGFSSGTYFARFTATSLKNNETFTDVKKLLLIK